MDDLREDVEISDIGAEVIELPAAFADLGLAIRRAASDLENQGEKSDRIATQLLTALARFHAECGT